MSSPVGPSARTSHGGLDLGLDSLDRTTSKRETISELIRTEKRSGSRGALPRISGSAWSFGAGLL
jgi:hypothetical protein